MKRLFCLLLLIPAGSLLAQHSFTQIDIEDGGRLFRANCAICHGAEGNQVPGIDLAHGIFRRAKTDEDIVSIMRNGIPGTAMPPTNFNDSVAMTVVAYLRTMAAASATTVSGGDPTRGKAIYDGKGNCASCHRVRGVGSRSGPDLSDIGLYRLPGELERSLTEPDAEILPQNRQFRGVTKDGASITGTLLNEDKYSIQILDSHDRLVSLRRASLREFSFTRDKSPMPSYKDKLTHQELSDLVSYLFSLRGAEVR
jgi:putative heme-binding domain-containing protein